MKDVEYFNVPKVLNKYLLDLGYKLSYFYSYKDFLDDPGSAKRFEELFESLEDAQTVATAAGVYDEDFDYLVSNYC